MMSIGIQVPAYEGASPGDVSRAAMPTQTRVAVSEVVEAELPPVLPGADGSLFLNLGSMRTGNLYTAVLASVQVVLRKNRDGSVDFFSTPE